MSRIPVLLVDDDRIILGNIAERIDWDGLGFRIVGTAPNGAGALTLYEQLRPELVITDVVMPVMGGLELIREIRRINPAAQILLISSYEEFAYVKEAIALGARGYVLKSELFEEAFLDELRAVKADITSDLTLRLGAERAALEQFFAARETEAVVSDAWPDAQAASDPLKRHGSSRLRFALFFEMAPFYLHEQDAPDPAIKRAERARLLTLCGAAELCFFVDDALVVALPEATPADWQACAKRLSPGFRRRFSWVYTQRAHTLGELRALLGERAVSLRFLRHCLPDAPCPLEDVPKSRSVPEKFAYIRLIDESADASQIEEDIRRYLRAAFGLWDCDSLETFIHRFTFQMEALTMFATTLEAYRFFPSAEQLIAWAAQTYKRCRAIAARGHAEAYSQPVWLAIRHMEAHYARSDLRTEDIALAASLSMSRLQVVFKQEIGKTINEYLTDLRIGRAIQLLEQSQMKVYEVAEAVGYASSQYFSQVLYQRTQKRPLDYRRASMG